MANRAPGMTVEGGARLRRTLKQSGSDLEELKDANKQAADIVHKRGRGTAPRRSGALAASMRVGATKTQGVIRAGNNRKTATGVPYANVIHWGWPKRNIAAQPWLSEAAEDTQEEWIDVYSDLVEAAINKVKGA